MNRKDEHLKYAIHDDQKNRFDDMFLPIENLVDVDLDDVDLSSSFMGFHIQYPIYINAMTGGSENAKQVNERLAMMANYLNIPMICGSQSILLKEPSTLNSFAVIRKHHQGILIGNLSLNHTLENFNSAEKLIHADGMSIHLNILQELVMQEGDRKFKHLSSNLSTIVSGYKKPLLVKEVGFGMSEATMLKLKEMGVRYIDVSGKGGTNFATIEYQRQQNKNQFLATLGYQTLDCLLMAKRHNLSVYASGGIRHALDVIKALVLGAEAVGLAHVFLKMTYLPIQEMYKQLDQLVMDLKKIMVALNCRSIADLRKISYEIK